MNRKHSERCGKLAHITFNQVVLGSSPSGLTKQNHILTRKLGGRLSVKKGRGVTEMGDALTFE